MVQSELVHLRSVHWIITRKFSFLYLLPSFPFFNFGFWLGLFVRLFFAIWKDKTTSFRFFVAVMYMETFHSESALALTNLHLSVFFVCFHQKYSTGERTFSCVRRIVGVCFWSNFARDIHAMFEQAVSINSVQCHRSRRNVTTPSRLTNGGGHEASIGLVFKHGANARKT